MSCASSCILRDIPPVLLIICAKIDSHLGTSFEVHQQKAPFVYAHHNGYVEVGNPSSYVRDLKSPVLPTQPCKIEAPYIHVHIHIHALALALSLSLSLSHTHTHKHTNTPTHTHTHMHTLMHSLTHIYTYTHVQTHTHTRTQTC